MAAWFLLAAQPAHATPPDLTAGGVPANSETINLGPTGMRGWVYHTNNANGTSNRADTSESRQIQLQIVDTGSPAAGIMAAGDVILGADGIGSEPVHFTSDARRSLANAITDAEARNPATLKLLVWRSATTSTMTITLRTMGAYSATAPYNCPKSAKILEEGLQYIMSSETSGIYSFGAMSLLAGNNPANPNNAPRMARAQTEARALIPSVATMTQMMSNTRDATASGWERGHTLVFLSEYYLATGDTQVIPAIRAYAVNIAKNQSLFGTLGHIYSDPWPDGSPNGPMGGGYGVINSAAMPCFLGILLAKQCGITDAEIDPAIERASRFFAYYANKGTAPYGEHEPAYGGHENNGKSGLAALAFGLQANRAMEGRFFAKMATAAATEREMGHTGTFFNYLWAPLGAAAGGEQAAAAHFSQICWMLDLNRKWNGGFDYDCLYGEGPNSGTQYGNNIGTGFRMSTAALLTYALPLRRLYITGRGHDPARWLTSTEVSEAAAVDGYKAANRTVSQLVSDLGNWSPMVQRSAGEQLGTRTLDSATINQIIGLATDSNGLSREGACIALGKINDSASVVTRAATLAGLLTDPQNHVRFMAAEGMRYLPKANALIHLNTILSAAASTAKPLIPLNEEDPLHMAHGRLAMLLFNGSTVFGPVGIISGSDVSVAPRNLLYPAIKAVAANPIGLCRSSLTSVYSYLTQADFLSVADAVVDVVHDRAPADRMFSAGARVGGIQTMQKFGIAEGVPLSLAVMNDDGGEMETVLNVLKLYAGSSTTVVPNPDVVGYCQSLINQDISTVSAQAVMDLIAADTNPAPLTPLKSIQSLTADNPGLTLPNKWTTLRTTSNDYANGASVYTWRKVHGAGNVSFTPNGTTNSKNTTVLFDGTPGHYLFEVKMSDSRGLTEVTSTVAVALYQSGGTLPPNSPPVADNQSPSVPRTTSTPITLTGSDPEGLPMNYSVATKPTHGTLTGSAPCLVYTSDFNYTGGDSFTFQVQDSEGQTSLATVSITVAENNNFPTAIYEPFNYAAGSLNGASGASEVGFSGAWTASASANVVGGSLAYGILPTLGDSIGNLNVGSNNYGGKRAVSSSALVANGLLSDGSTLWFSMVMGYGSGANTTNARLALALGNSNFSTGNGQYFIINEGAQLGSGLGVTLGRFDGINGKFVATQFHDSTLGTPSYGTVPSTIIGGGQQRLVVGKITWGAGSDTIELYEPDANLNLGTVTSTLTVDVNQSIFDTITWTRGDAVTMDEIRFGPNYASVLLGNTPMTADTIAPAPATMAFYQTPTVASTSSISMEAVTAYDPNGEEYYFTCTAGGGHDSGWQASPYYTDAGLTPGTLYSYTVKARDMSPARNQTVASPATSAMIGTQATLPHLVGMQRTTAESIVTMIGLTVGTVTISYNPAWPSGCVISQSPTGDQTQALGTVVDFVVSGDDMWAPTPNPATFAVVPAAASFSTITMTAASGSDLSGVEYLFTETSGNPGGSSSGWQDSPSYTDSGLSPVTQYTYTVTLRDKSPNANQTAASAPASATTTAIVPTTYIRQNNTGLLNTSVAWGGGPPMGIDSVQWDATCTANRTMTLGGNVTWGKIIIATGTAGTVTIGNTASSTLSLNGVGGTGIDMSAAPQDLTINDPITLGASQIWNITTSRTLTVGSYAIGDGGSAYGLTKSGAGTLVLQGSNTFSGPVSVTGGTLSISNINNVTSPNPLGQSSAAASNLLLANGTALTYTGSAASCDRSFTINGTAAGHGATINANGTGALNLTSTATIGYGTADQTRTLTIQGSNTTGVNILAARITNNGSGTVTLSKAGAGNIWSLTNSGNSFTGGVQLGRGILIFSSGALGTTGTITIPSNALPITLKWASDNTDDISGRWSFGAGSASPVIFDTGANDVTFASSLIGGTGTYFYKDGSGKLTLNGGSGNWTGTTIIREGTLAAKTLANGGAVSSIGSSPGTSGGLGLRGGTLQYTGSGATTNRNFHISTSSAIDASGTGALVFSQTGIISPNPSKSWVTINLSNKVIITGNTTDFVAGMKVSGAGIPSNTTITSVDNNNQITLSNNPTATTTGTPLTFGSYSAGVPITLTLTGTNTGANEIKGILRDSVSVISGDTSFSTLSINKTGAGKWTLSGANTYTGSTTISGGTLALGTNDILPNGSAVFIGTATLDAVTFTDSAGTLNATDAATINLGSGAALAFANSSTVGGGTWAGTLNIITGSLGATSIRFGTSGSGLTSNQLAKVMVNGSGLGTYALDASGYLVVGQTQYAAWSGGAAFAADANGDGIMNGLAWVLGATNTSQDALGLLPIFDNTSDPDYFIFTYRRNDEANNPALATIAAQYGSNLGGWTTAVHDGTNIIITTTNDFYGSSPGVDKVAVKIKRTLSPNGKLFTRLNVLQTQ